MSLRSQAALDMQNLINADGEDVTLTDGDGVEYDVKGLVFRADFSIDQETGLRIAGEKTSIQVSLLDLESEEPTEDWQVSTTDVLAGTITGQVVSPAFDRTLGVVMFNVELSEEV